MQRLRRVFAVTRLHLGEAGTIFATERVTTPCATF